MGQTEAEEAPMRLFATVLSIGVLTVTTAFAGNEFERHIMLEHARPIDVAQTLSREFGTLKSPVQIKAGERAGELVVGADRSVGAIIEQRARQLDVGPAQASGAMMMEFAVVEEEADGSKRVVAAPRVVSMPGQPAVVQVKGEDRGLELKVHPTWLANGRIQLGVDCKSWHSQTDVAGKSKVHAREVHSSVVVANGKRITLQSGGDRRMSLEMEVHAL
jgi:hypothetical protein